MNTDKMNDVYEAAQAFEEEFEARFIDVLEAYHEGVQTAPDEEYDGDLPEHQVHVVLDVLSQERDDVDYASQYTYPVCEFGREMGLYVFDHVVYLGGEVDNARTPQADYESDAVVKVRFGLESDREDRANYVDDLTPQTTTEES